MTKLRSLFVFVLVSFVVWPNASIPFYINPKHFDHDQSLAIRQALSTFQFKTCLKFTPVMVQPKNDEHVMVFENPEGIRRCKINNTGHSVYAPHSVLVGYECLKSPHIEMLIMKALGFNFEHNRYNRDAYIRVLMSNIDRGALGLFAKDVYLPSVLESLPYDINSVMHFGEREYSSNGQKTIKILDRFTKQNRVGLSDKDLKKIDLVYGKECLKRDRLEKVEMCKTYPGVARKKRSAEVPATPKSLRVNRDITPPDSQEKKDTEKPTQESEVSKYLKELGVEEEAQEVLEHVYKVSSKALKNARERYCNNSENYKPIAFKRSENRNASDVIGILEYLTEYVDGMVANAMSNLTIFCENPDSIVMYQRQICNWRFDNRCIPSYKSTKSGPVLYSTQHRPYIIQSTKHDGSLKGTYKHYFLRSRNDSDEVTTQKQVRRKREIFDGNTKERNQANGNKRSRNRRRYFESQQYGAINQATSSNNENSESKVSSEIQDRALTLESEVIKEPPSLAMKSAKVGIGSGRETKYFGAASKESVIKEKPLNDVENEENNDETISYDKKYIKNNNIEEKQSMKNVLENTQEKNQMRAEKLQKSSKDQTRDKKQVPPTIVLSKLNREFYTERMWPEGVVRYVITPLEGYDLEDMRSRLAEVNEILKKKTCVRLEEVTEEEAKNHEDYLVLDTSPDYITGRVGGKQHFGCLELFKGGQHRQHTAMMVMAMLGFYFEVARHDRDKYIRVHMRHIRPDKLHHFERIREEATLDLPYDFNSATHPAWQFWRKIGKTGISSVATFKTLDPNGSIMRTLGQHHNLLSDLDIVKINSVYGVECFTEAEDTVTSRDK